MTKWMLSPLLLLALSQTCSSMLRSNIYDSISSAGSSPVEVKDDDNGDGLPSLDSLSMQDPFSLENFSLDPALNINVKKPRQERIAIVRERKRKPPSAWSEAEPTQSVPVIDRIILKRSKSEPNPPRLPRYRPISSTENLPELDAFSLGRSYTDAQKAPLEASSLPDISFLSHFSENRESGN
jgi:hypothetical protein